MFESYLADVLNSSLCKYIEDLDFNQLKISMWKGNIELKNLKIRKDALTEYNLPIQIVFGHLGKLILKVPWTNLYSQAVHATVEDLYILFGPKFDIKYDAEKEAALELSAKKNALNSIDAALQREYEADKTSTDPSFQERLIARIVNNIQINVKNVHIRYEDFKTAEAPFACGVTLYNLELYTTNNNWEKYYLAEQTNRVFKLARLENFAVYMNCNTGRFGLAATKEVLVKYRDSIASEDNILPQIHYVLGPLSLEAKLSINTAPAQDDPPFSIPKFNFNLQMEKVGLSINGAQFLNVLNILESFNRMSLAAPYRKYYPYGVPYKGNAKVWWQYAINCILIVRIRENNRKYQWNYIKNHLKLCRSYAEAYKEILISTKPSASIIELCNLAEKKLDLFNLKLIRQRVFYEVQLYKEEMKNKKEEEKKTSGWFSGWFGSKKSDPEFDLRSRLKAAMTPEEKKKLYKAIGYDENSTPLELPKYFVATKVYFQLNTLEIGLYENYLSKSFGDEDYHITNIRNILLIQLSMSTITFLQRPGDNAMAIKSSIEEMKFLGFRKENDLNKPMLVQSSDIATEENLFSVEYELRPLNTDLDQRLKLHTNSLRIVYDSETILQLYTNFMPPKKINLSELEGAATLKISTFKERSATGMQYMLDKHAQFDIDVHCKPNIVIIPYCGDYDAYDNIIVISLGTLRVFCQPRNYSEETVNKLYEKGEDPDKILETVMNNAYDVYNITIADLQVIVTKEKENWAAVLSQHQDTIVHILKPTSVIVDLRICIIDNDPRLPRCKVLVTLPGINLILTEERILEVIKIIFSIKLPFDKNETKPLLKRMHSNSSIKSHQIVRSATPQVRRKLSLTAEVIQHTSLDFNVSLQEFSITLYVGKVKTFAPKILFKDEENEGSITKNSDLHSDSEYFDASNIDELLLINNENLRKLLSLQIIMIRGFAAQRTFENVANASLGAICVNYYNNDDSGNIIETFIIDTPGYKLNQNPLLNVSFCMVDAVTPDFITKYKSIEKLAEVNFSILNIKLHKENLLSLMKTVGRFIEKAFKIANIPLNNSSIESFSDFDRSTLKKSNIVVSKEIKVDEKSSKQVIESIKFNIIANMELITLELTCKKRSLAFLKIVELNAGIVMKSSYNEIKCNLKDIVLEDPNPLTKHSTFLSIVGQDAINCNVLMYNLPNNVSGHTENMKLHLEIGCVKVIYLNWFLVTIMNYMSYFSGASDVIVFAGTKAADAAKQNVLDANKVTKVLLNIKVKAPIIIIPIDSQSDDAIVIDTGLLKVNNAIKSTFCNECNNLVVIDEIDLDLNDMKITRAVMVDTMKMTKTVKIQGVDEVDYFYGYMTNFNILNRSSFMVNIKRNLSFSICKHFPLFDLSASLKVIELNLFTDDYNLVMSIANYNFKEGHSEFVRKTVKTTIRGKTLKKHKERHEYRFTGYDGGNNEKAESNKNLVQEQYRFSINLDGFIINLMKNATSGVAKFGMYLMSVKGKQLINGTTTFNLILCNAQLEDRRPKIKSVYKTYLCRKDWLLFERIKKTDEEENVLDHCTKETTHMIDFTCILTNRETIVKLFISGFDLIICVDFLYKLTEFFKSYTDTNIDDIPYAPAKQGIDHKKVLNEHYSTHTIRPVRTTFSMYNAQHSNVNKITDINIVIEEPEIMLVENLEDVNTNAIIFNFQSEINFRSVNDAKVMKGIIDGLKMYMCSFHPKHRANTRHYILHPCVVNINNSQPESNDFSIHVKFSDIMINITPITIELISKAVKSITTTKTKKIAKLSTITYQNIWQERYVDERDHWYIRTDSAEDALSDTSLDEFVDVVAVSKNETCVVEINSIIVILEMGIGYYTQPLISIETRLNAILNNWSSNINVQGTLLLKIDYYNAVLAAWEPVVEPIERIANDGDEIFTPWYLDFNLWIDHVPSHYDNKKNLNVTKIKIESTDNLLMTISKTFVELMTKISISFQDAIHPSGLLKPSVIAPYLIENDTGYELMLDLTIGLFTLHESHISGKYSGNINDSIDIILKNEKERMSYSNLSRCKILLGGKVYLQLKEIYASKNFSEDDYNIYVEIIGSKSHICLPISKADKRYFSVYNDLTHDIMGIVSDVNCEYGTTVINIHSVLNIENHFTSPIYVFYKKPGVRDMLDVGIAEPNTVFHVPLQVVYNEYRLLYFNVDEYDISTNAVKWDDSPNDMKYTCQVQCEPLRSVGPLLINVQREKTEIFFENTNKFKLHSAYYTLHLRPPICLRNALPVDITVSVAGTAINMNEELDKILQSDIHRDSIKTLMPQSYHLLPKHSDIMDFDNFSMQSNSDQFMHNDKSYRSTFNDDLLNYGEKEVMSGHSLYLPTMKISNRKSNNPTNYLVVKLMQYLEKDWVCVTEIVSTKNELCDWRFTSYDSEHPMHLDLYAKCEMRSTCLEVTLFSPFWLINKTDLMLSYKVDTETVGVIYHPAEYDGPIFFTFRSQNYWNKKSCSIRVDNGEWSKKIPLDASGSSGCVICKAKDKSFQIAVHNHITHNTLTKQITFMPYYILVNKCAFFVDVQQYARPADPWKRLSQDDCKPLWPVDDFDRILIAKIHGQLTVPFKYSEPMVTLLALENNNIGGINVEVHVSEGGIYIIFTEYHPGDAPGLIINYTSVPIKIVEKGLKTAKSLAPRHKILYTWSKPSEDRQLLFNNETGFNLQHDAVGNFKVDNQKIYWVSFLDGLQRILLFTESQAIARRSESTTLLQIINQSVEIIVHGIGVSIVNNQSCTPILYMAITSSGIIWESRKDDHKRFKVLSLEDSDELEHLYNKYLLEKEQDAKNSGVYTVDNKEVNFMDMTLQKEDKLRQIRRTFLAGAWIMMETSPFQLQLHIKINRIQIDNQLYEYVFPVLLAPIPPPKTLSKSTHYKPFVECSIIQQILPNSSVRQYKYVSMLVQEFHIKIDLTLLMAVVDMFCTTDVDEKTEVALFREDIKNITKPLYEVIQTHSQYEHKNFYDNLHLGPMKVHVSFSLSGVEPSAPPQIISKLIQSVGVTLTDVNDVVLRLAFFERNHNFFTTKELFMEIKNHYIGQALKQVYVLVLGLDVLGNPYGLVIGFKRGFEDLFYEPYQGDIQGPGEFVEGLVLGVRSLFGHTIGGAANAVSKITGAMGKGLAVLTFDDEYQKKRRQALSKKPRSFHEGMAQSSKGLVMGFVDGITGVVTKPITGAKEQGVGGFVKGLGKGTIGLITRPTAGIIDFAHGTFDSVKRATDPNAEVKRLRPPRFQSKDGVLRPYRLNEAKGFQLLKELEKGKFAVTDTFVYYDEIPGRNEYVLITNYRIMYVSRNETFAVWSLQWSFLFTEITRLITNDEGIEINLHREKRKVFYSPTVSKFIPIKVPKKRENLVRAIETQINQG